MSVCVCIVIVFWCVGGYKCSFMCVCMCVWGKGSEIMTSRSRTAVMRKPTQLNESYIAPLAPRDVWCIVVVWWDNMGSHLLPPSAAEGGFLDKLRWSWNEIPISSDAACSFANIKDIWKGISGGWNSVYNLPAKPWAHHGAASSEERHGLFCFGLCLICTTMISGPLAALPTLVTPDHRGDIGQEDMSPEQPARFHWFCTLGNTGITTQRR